MKRLPLTHIALTLFVLLATGLTLQTLVLTGVNTLPGPFRDDWETIPLRQAFLTGQLTWQDLWQTYAGVHRLVIPRLLFLLDTIWFGAGNTFLTVLAVFSQGTGVFMVGWAGYRLYPERLFPQAVTLCLALLLLFNAGQLYNLTYAFDIQWFVATIGAVAACLSLVAYTQAPSIPLGLGVLGFALLATLGNFAGLLIWPVLSLLGWFLLPTRKAWGVLTLAGLGVWAVYTLPLLHRFLVGLDTLNIESRTLPPAHLLILSVVKTWGEFLLRFLGSPWSPWGKSANLALGLIGALGILWVLPKSLGNLRHQPSTYRGFFPGLLLFALGVAAAITLGRGFIMHEATTSRFLIISLLFWLGLLGSGLMHLQTPRQQLLLLGAALLVAWPCHRHNAVAMTAVMERAQHSQLAAGIGLRDMDTLFGTLSWHMPQNHRNPAADHERFLKHHRLGYYRLPIVRWQGRTLPANLPDCPAAGGGKPIDIERGEWRLHLRSPVRPDYWLVSLPEGRVVGGLRQLRLRGELLPDRWQPDDAVHWNGFALLPEPARRLVATAMRDDTPVCQGTLTLRRTKPAEEHRP